VNAGRTRALLAALLTAALGACGCATAPAAKPAKTPASLALISLSPRPGSFVDSGTMVRAQLYYVLPEGYPGDYFVDPWFAVVDKGETAVRPVGAIGVVRAREPRGYVTVEFPLLRVLSAARLAKPVQIWFSLEMVNGDRTSPAAHAGPYLFTAGAR
jgi:hypothetical protein